MQIGEPPSEPLLAPRATCTILHLESAGEPDLRWWDRAELRCGEPRSNKTRRSRPFVDARTGLLTWRHCSVVKELLRGTRREPAESLTLDRFAAPTPPPNRTSRLGGPRWAGD